MRYVGSSSRVGSLWEDTEVCGCLTRGHNCLSCCHCCCLPVSLGWSRLSIEEWVYWWERKIGVSGLVWSRGVSKEERRTRGEKKKERRKGRGRKRRKEGRKNWDCTHGLLP